MFLRKSFNSLPILAMVCGVRACKPVSYYPPILSNALVIGVIQCHVSGTEDGLSNILFQLVHNHNDAACPQAGGGMGVESYIQAMVFMPASRKTRFIMVFVFDNYIS